MSIRLFWQSLFRIDTRPAHDQFLVFITAQGKVIEPIGPANVTGRVQLQGVSWLARCGDTLLYPLPVGTPVKVIDRVGLTLIIRPLAMSVTWVNQLPSVGLMVSSIHQKTAA
ncbi:NfeD family protein [Leptothoe sp. PORK10 BA2]|uniref:NfeD family protein n=1 Tax=Leptothoe sp. PORK10 BA2 TaxID=3110254 RepID=UPI002B1F44E0|nr:NfeD family protein [Leptothoe sp. PORK10 BA2]MEA5467059.1 NfeD family protein [Leptothoe sp. PORK10 BA2]